MNRAIFLSPTALDWDVPDSVSARQGADRRERVDLPRGSAARPATPTLPPARALRRERHDVSCRRRAWSAAPRCDRQRSRRAVSQLPHGLHAARPGHGHQPDDDQHQGLERQRARNLELHRDRQRRAAGRRQSRIRSYTSRGTSNAPLTLTVDNYCGQRDCATAAATAASAAATATTATTATTASTTTASPSSSSAAASPAWPAGLRHVHADCGQWLGFG